jgi:hypothetical protein
MFIADAILDQGNPCFSTNWTSNRNSFSLFCDFCAFLRLKFPTVIPILIDLAWKAQKRGLAAEGGRARAFSDDFLDPRASSSRSPTRLMPS